MADMLIEAIENFGLSQKDRSKSLFSKIGIIGCGNEGQNIARIAAFYGIEVAFVELSEIKIEAAIENISHRLDRRIENWAITPNEKRAIMSRIKGSLNYDCLKGCDFVIEAIRSGSKVRSIEERKQIFLRIEKSVTPDCIIATNCTTVAISELASELQYKERCISLHFFLSHEAKLVEVSRSLYTTDEVYEKVCLFIKMINRSVIPVEEAAGIISVRIFCVLLNEACETLMQGTATIADIDRTLEKGYGMRQGPFAMADRVGLDKVERWMENLYKEFGAIKYIPSPIIKKLVRSKRLGINTLYGFYKYNENGQTDTSSR